jgi:glycosyltransferase involved in cell wall biosynthesis
MNRLSLPTAHRVVTVCDAFARELATRERVPENKISVQHNSIRVEQAVDEEEARLVRARLGIKEDASVVLAVGRLSSEKAHADLLSAFRHLRDAHPEINARLLIVGDGPERKSLETLARVLNINERVHFAGQVSDVRAFYAAAQVLALPSHSEGSPYVLLEAMAAHLPVVATRVGGVPEMVEDEESALLVHARDPQKMAAAIARVLTDAQLARKLTANASALIATRYSPETYVRSLVEIYRQLISNAAGRNVQPVSHHLT